MRRLTASVRLLIGINDLQAVLTKEFKISLMREENVLP